MIPKSVQRFSDKIVFKEKHDPEKCAAVFGQGHAQGNSVIPKHVQRISTNMPSGSTRGIVLKQETASGRQFE
jgi:hypothetical protein